MGLYVMSFSVSVCVIEKAAKAKALERMVKALVTEGIYVSSRVNVSVAIVWSQCDQICLV